MAPILCSSMPEIKVGHIDDIQELRRARPTMVPERYIRDNSERPTRARLPDSLQIPIIDMSKMIWENDVQFHHELAKLATACEEWGFFQVINHGIDTHKLEDMEEVAREFFDLPLEEKEKYPMKPGTIQGYGHAFVFSEDQKLDWCNMLALGVEPPFIRDSKLWPTNPSHFSETLDKYSVEIRKLCHILLRLIARSLRRVEENVFNDMFGTAVQAVRMNYYPPCPRPDLVLGLSPHSDGSALTVLQQETDTVGLQILKDGAWVPVHPIQNALVINIGDTIEVLTNGKYKSVEHRAITNKKKDRLSLVTFYAPSYDVELGPLPEFVDENRPCMYRKYNHGDYSRHYVTNRLEGKKTLEFAKIAEQL
ncbi:Protein SRG1 [Acorus calamus]|uniref:Protein SRG1 n=1 Tax=Acorus calamus TaxID=4465 RepID=A0AAV9CRC2_ACOCL|nr:Protein SRG1 [Acorus calamus]